MSAVAVIGAGGGIGGALVTALMSAGSFETIHALSRRPGAEMGGGVRPGAIDVTNEATIRSAASGMEGTLDLVIVATGLLHEEGYRPERSLRELDPDRLARAFSVNTIGPALVLKHFAPLLPRERRSVMAVLSARVGSIGDNRSGGWYGYRASKAALNMIVRSAAIELARTRPQSICVGLHPGTVDTGLSQPFQATVPAERLFSPERAARQLLDVIDGLTPAASGRCFAWDRSEIVP